jgi:hypothetical protein
MHKALVGGLVALSTVLAYPVGLRADEAAAVAWVTQHGGKIARDDKQPGRPVIKVDLYRIGGSQVTDARLKELSAAVSNLNRNVIGRIAR